MASPSWLDRLWANREFNHLKRKQRKLQRKRREINKELEAVADDIEAIVIQHRNKEAIQ